MLNPRWRKILRDMWHSKTRTILVVLSIAVGVFAVGMIVSTQIMLSDDLTAGYLATNPASAELYPAPFDDDLVQVVRRMKSVKEAEGRRGVSIRLQVGPDEWRSLQLDVLADFDDNRIHKIRSVSGAWPPPKKTLLIERASLNLIQAEVGDTVVVETPDGKQRQMRIAGVVHDMNNPPAQFSGTTYGCITEATLEWLGFEPYLTELHIIVAENGDDEDHIQTVADKVQNKIEKTGRTVYWIWIPPIGQHPASEVMDPMMIVLGVLGGLSLCLSSFLVVNTISALLTQQKQQIGIMKAVGARTGQIVRLYLVMILVFSLLSLVVAVPSGAWAAYIFTQYLAGLINFDLAGFRIPPQALAVEVGVGLIVPLLAALYPVLAGTRVTVQEAISTYGLGKGIFGQSIVDRFIGMVTSTLRIISRPMRLSLRNMFRRKARLLLTLLTLTLSGAIFIAVLSVQASLLTTLDDALSYWNYDIEVNFAHPHRIVEIDREAMRIPGVVAVESWGLNTARRIRPDGHEGPNMGVIAPPADTALIQPTMLEGRWLLPEDENALVVNTNVLEEETHLQVGDEIVLKIEGRETTWQIVGVAKGVLTGRLAYANRPYFAEIVRFVGKTGRVQIVGTHHDAEFQADLAKTIKDRFDQRGMQVRSTDTIASIRENVEYQFNIIVVLLLIMAVLLAVVGGLGLMGTMSINVLERTREIGVMRALGATDNAVLKIVMVEGLLVGGLSWLIGVILSVPMSQLMSSLIGVAFMDSPLSYTFSFTGAVLWLVIVMILAALASFLPAWNASRLTVRAVLAYE